MSDCPGSGMVFQDRCPVCFDKAYDFDRTGFISAHPAIGQRERCAVCGGFNPGDSTHVRCQ